MKKKLSSQIPYLTVTRQTLLHRTLLNLMANLLKLTFNFLRTHDVLGVVNTLVNYYIFDVSIYSLS